MGEGDAEAAFKLLLPVTVVASVLVAMSILVSAVMV